MKEAADLFTQAIKEDSAFAPAWSGSKAHIQYGRFLRANGKPRDAHGEFETARRAAPESAMILSNMAYAFAAIVRRLKLPPSAAVREDTSGR